MLVALCLGVILSIFLLTVYHNWYAPLIPWLCAYLLEYCLRLNQGRFTPPLYQTISTYAKTKKRPVMPQTTNVAFKINSSSQLMIADFIQCKFFGNYDSLKLHIAIYNNAELEQHFARLCQQYQEVKKDKNTSEYVKVKGGLLAIEYQWAVVNTWANMLNERYSDAVADGLRKLYPLFKFNAESWRSDLAQVKIIEDTTGAIKHHRFETALAKLESTATKDISNKEQYANFLAVIRDCRKLFGSFDINTTSMDELAVYEIGLSEEIKRLEEQIRKQK